MVSCQNQPRSLKQRHPAGGRWPDSLWLRLCLFAMAIFEVDASLKWIRLWSGCLGNQSLSQALALKKRRPNCQGLPYHRTRCCCCKGAQLCQSLYDPMDCRPPGSSAHGTFPGENTGVGCHFLLYRTRWVSPKSPSSWIRILRANCLPTECDAAVGLASLTKNQQTNLLELVRKGNRFGKWVMCWCQFLKDCRACALWKWYIWRFILLRKLVFMFCTLQTFWSGKWGLFFLWPTHQLFLL